MKSRTDLETYRSAVHLDQAFNRTWIEDLLPEEQTEVVDQLVDWLAGENQGAITRQILKEFPNRRQALRAFLNIRPPEPIPPQLLNQLNRLLQTEMHARDIVGAKRLRTLAETISGTPLPSADRLVLWEGDITCLEIDAIVNAANQQLLGCFHPLHACIDNAIHSSAGPQLREDCSTIMRLQGGPEATGDAKITRAYHLPARFVLHTVGPIVPQGSGLTSEHESLLASCYASCLELACRVASIDSIAFPAISTGLFGFPKKEAAGIAVHTVDQWLHRNPGRLRKVVFCVFSREDYLDYVEVLQK